MLKTIAPFVRPRRLVEWRTTGQWRMDDEPVLPFRPNYTVVVPMRLRVAGPLEPDDAALEECDDAPNTQ